MKIKTYYIEFYSCKDGVVYSLDKTVEAADIYNAMKVVENYCHDNYGTCEITSVKKVNKDTFTCEVCKRKYQWASPCTPDDCEDRFKDFCKEREVIECVRMKND